MPTYAYEALNAAGKPQSGTVEATTSDEAVQMIKGEGFFPTSVREQKVKGDGRVRGGDKGTKKRKEGGVRSLSIGCMGRKHRATFPRHTRPPRTAGSFAPSPARGPRERPHLAAR